jgi:hypothetical protein
MINAAEEFTRHIGNRVVIAVRFYNRNTEEHMFWREDMSQWNSILNWLDFDYDSGFGGQVLEGNIWYNDGTWSKRGEYDGSEWWEHVVRTGIEPYQLRE